GREGPRHRTRRRRRRRGEPPRQPPGRGLPGGPERRAPGARRRAPEVFRALAALRGARPSGDRRVAAPPAERQGRPPGDPRPGRRVSFPQAGGANRARSTTRRWWVPLLMTPAFASTSISNPSRRRCRTAVSRTRIVTSSPTRAVPTWVTSTRVPTVVSPGAR